MLSFLSQAVLRVQAALRAIRPRKDVIMGCVPTPLLTRWKILETVPLKIFVHKFHRSDEDRELHNHPWAFVSIILWNGYTEVTPPGPIQARILAGDLDARVHPDYVVRRHYGPGRILWRSARWAHRVEITEGKPSLSIVFAFRKAQKWGFFTSTGWLHDKLFYPTRRCE